VWVEIVPEAQQRLAGLQQPIAEEMREVAQRFKAEELAVVRDFMRQAKEVFQHQVKDAVSESVRDAVRESVRSAQEAADEAARSARESVRDSVRESVRSAREAARSAREAARTAHEGAVKERAEDGAGEGAEGEPPTQESGGKTG
jgi:non-homologous end joining protein Ku